MEAMTDPSDPGLPLTEELEAAVLAILEGDDRDRRAALEALMNAHPRHAPALRAWRNRVFPHRAPPRHRVNSWNRSPMKRRARNRPIMNF